MPPLPPREVLEKMKRVDLQQICKDYGVKANLKSEALIELLLDTQSGPRQAKPYHHLPPAPPPQPQPAPQPTRRSVSTRQSSGKAGPSRVSSMIVHDISEDEEEDQENGQQQLVEREPPAQPIEQPPPRTRKAKELQTRLGMGKPVIAGGMGARNITRSSAGSVGSKPRRGKSSRSMIPMEATIMEEEPEPASPPPKEEPSNRRFSGSSRRSGPPADNVSLAHVQSLIDKAINPLQEQIRVLKSELNQMQTMKSELDSLKSQVSNISNPLRDPATSGADQISLVSLKEEIQQIKDLLTANESPPLPSTPKGRNTQLSEPPAGFGMPAGLNEIYPGITETVLGKRHRTATPTQIEPDLQEELSKEAPPRAVLGPVKKKPKLQGSKAGTRQSSRQPSGGDRRSPTDDVNAFTVFRGSAEAEEYVDPPPPTNRLPDFFEPGSPQLTSTVTRPKVTRSSANAAENQPQSFGFGFLPISSTPRDPMYMPSFPYPEAPQSPSPAGPSRYASRNDDRTDIFKNFGLPSPIKASRNYGALTQDRGVNPAALTEASSSKPVETSLHMGPVPSSSNNVDPPLTKATMYGTELDGDTRFGDFGLDHMATGYWANKRY